MAKNHVLAIVLAGGEGKRLMPLTMDRAKPAVPFGGHYRLIDFSLSNMVNSGYMKIVVLTQYKSHSLDRHVTRTWYTSPLLGNFIAPVPAQQRRGPHWYLGSADAIYQSLNIVDDENPDYIVITGADNIYRMDFSQMVQHHIDSGLPATVAGIRQPIEVASALGVIEGKDGHVDRFVEKPQNPVGLEDDPTIWVGISFRGSLSVECAATTTSRTTLFPVRRIETAITGATSVPWMPTTRQIWTSLAFIPSLTSTTGIGPR